MSDAPNAEIAALLDKCRADYRRLRNLAISRGICFNKHEFDEQVHDILRGLGNPQQLGFALDPRPFVSAAEKVLEQDPDTYMCNGCEMCDGEGGRHLKSERDRWNAQEQEDHARWA